MTKKIIVLTLSLLTITLVSKAQVDLLSGGTSAAYTVLVPGAFQLTTGLQVTFRAHTASSASATLNVSGSGAKSITKVGGSTAIAGSDIKTNQIVTVAYDGASWQMLSAIGTAGSTGTVTSVSFAAPTQFSVAGSPLTTSGTLTLGWQSAAQNLVLATPDGVAGQPSLRTLVPNDIPGLPASKITSGVLPLVNGGTGSSLAAVNGGFVYSTATGMAITTAGTSGQVLQSNGAAVPTWVTPSFLPGGANGQTLRNNGAGWIANSTLYNDGTNIGIGVVPTQKLHVTGGQIYSNWASPNGPANLFINNWNSATGPGSLSGTLGLVSIATSDAAEDKYAIQGAAGGDGGSKYGIYGASQGLGQNYGGKFSANGGGSNYGIFSQATSAGTSTDIASWSYVSGSGTGTTYGVYAQNASSNTGLTYAGYFENMNSTGSNIYGVRSNLAGNSGTGGSKYGMYSQVTGTAPTNYAGYFLAAGGTNNYAIVVPSGGGYVGIGTTAPNTTLDVANSTIVTTSRFMNTFNGASNTAVYGGTTGASAGGTNYGGSFNATGSTGNNYAVYGYASGNSGAKTGVYGGAVGTGTNIGGYFSASGGTTNNALQLVDGSQAVNRVLTSNASGVATWTDLAAISSGSTAWTRSTPNIYPTTLTDNVGIGLNAPTTKMQIHSTSGIGNLRLTGASTGTLSTDGFSMSNDGSNVMYMTQQENDDWYFNTNGGTLGIMIKPTGNVGIGTATVNNKLDVEGAAVIGANYSGTNTAPGNGLLVEGSVAIGTTSTSAKTAIYGSNDPLLLLDGPVGAQSPLVFATAGTNKWAWYLPTGGADLTLWHYGAPSQNYINFNGTNGHVNIVPTAGNVGIGVVATPSEKLEVAGNVEITSIANGFMIENDTVLRSNGSTSMYIGQTGGTGGYGVYAGYRAGNVSTGVSNTFVGTESGEVNTSGTQNAFFGLRSGRGNTIGNYNTFIGRDAGIFNTTGSNNTTLGYNANVSSGALTYASAIGYNASIGQSYGMALGGTGAEAIEVGIGVNNNMSGKLHVYSSTETYNTPTQYNSSIYGEVAGAIFSSRGIMGVSWATGTYGIGAYGSSGGTAINNYGVYGNATGGTNNYAGYFDAGDVFINNNLGIGVTPSYKLHVQLASTGILAYFDNNSPTGGTALNANLNVTATGAGTRYGLYTTTWYGQGLNYGIYSYGYGGTNAYGIYAYAAGGTTANWAVYANGNQYSTSGTAWTTSDEKFKNNIQRYSGALDMVNKLDIKTYYYDTEEFKDMNLPKGKQFGFLAQDLEKVFPEMVMNTKLINDDMRLSNPKNDPNYEPKMIDAKVIKTDGLIPVALQAIKEQQAIIEDLKTQLEAQKLRIEALEKK